MKLEDFNKEVRGKLVMYLTNYLDAKIEKHEAVESQLYANATDARERERLNMDKMVETIFINHDENKHITEKEIGEVFGMDNFYVGSPSEQSFNELKIAVRNLNINEILEN